MKVGDIVALKSGGPDMTLCKLEGEFAHCCWFNGDAFYKQEIPVSALAVNEAKVKAADDKAAAAERALAKAEADNKAAAAADARAAAAKAAR